MKIDEILACSIDNWYADFESLTFATILLPLPAQFIEYLQADGIFLPLDDEDAESEVANSAEAKPATSCFSSSPELKDFNARVKEAIAALHGAVLPKLNWSSPKDALWITADNSLCCNTPAEVYLLLKSSDFISHDLTQPFLLCEDFSPAQAVPAAYCLALRQWAEINPAFEFRCFVFARRLIAVSQRHANIYFDCFAESATLQRDVLAALQVFFDRSIANKFVLSSFTFDCCLKNCSSSAASYSVTLIDFNPWGDVTDCLLFSWEELCADELSSRSQELSFVPELRCVTSPGVQPSPYDFYAMPMDFYINNDVATNLENLNFNEEDQSDF